MNQTDTSINKRYSDEELEEFRQLINTKLQAAQKEYNELANQITHNKAYDNNDGGRQFNDMIDESASHAQRSEIMRLMKRQNDFIKKLQAALVRIDNKTYGICRATGNLISKDRLRAVPHATLSMEGKLKK